MDLDKFNYYLKHPEEAICDYIRSYDGPTKKMVADALKVEVNGDDQEINICARETSDKKIDEMIGEGRIIDRRKGKGFHRLYLNDKDEYNDLVNTIENLSKTITRWKYAVNSHFMLIVRDCVIRHPHSGVLFFKQMMYYSYLTKISTYIKNNIKCQNDIEKLYFRLSDILINLSDADKLLKAIYIKEIKIKNNDTIKGWSGWGVMEITEDDDCIEEIMEEDYDIKEMTKDVHAFIKEMTEEADDCIEEMIKIQSRFPS